MQLNIRLKLFIITIGIFTLSGCASTDYGTVIDSSEITIERQRSRIANIGQVTIYKQKEGYLIRGKVTRNAYVRGHISGHLDIELLNAKNKVIFKTSTIYQHVGIRFNHGTFSLKLDKAIEKGSRLLITHVESTRHND